MELNLASRAGARGRALSPNQKKSWRIPLLEFLGEIVTGTFVFCAVFFAALFLHFSIRGVEWFADRFFAPRAQDEWLNALLLLFEVVAYLLALVDVFLMLVFMGKSISRLLKRL